MKYLPPAFIGVCVAQLVGNMQYLPPAFIGVLFLNLWET